MSETQTRPSTNRFRLMVLVFACLLGGLAAWILLAEILRPKLEITTDTRNAAIVAAKVGVVRGDLWSDAALGFANSLWTQGTNISNADLATFERARKLIEHAIAYAPYDSRMWLLLAANYVRSDRLSERASAALRMSYYTGPNRESVIPKRLFLAVQSRALHEGDFRELVGHDLRVAVARKSVLMPAVLDAYMNAPLFGKQFIENELAAISPSMLASIRSQAGNR